MASGRVLTTERPGPMLLLLFGLVRDSERCHVSEKLTRIGTYFQDASSTYTSDPVGIAWVTFDSTSGSKGSPTPRIFVGRFPG
jgi:hypothetical protein